MISRKIKKRIRKQEKQGIKKAREKKELQEGRKEGRRNNMWFFARYPWAHVAVCSGGSGGGDGEFVLAAESCSRQSNDCVQPMRKVDNKLKGPMETILSRISVKAGGQEKPGVVRGESINSAQDDNKSTALQYNTLISFLFRSRLQSMFLVLINKFLNGRCQ